MPSIIFDVVKVGIAISVVGLIWWKLWPILSLNPSQVRDEKRKKHILQIQVALQLYYETNEQYPRSGGASSPNSGWSNSADDSWKILGKSLSPFLETLPIDPKQDDSGWPGEGACGYAFYSLGHECGQEWYMLVFRLENASGPDPGTFACDGTFYQFGGGDSDTNVKTVSGAPKT